MRCHLQSSECHGRLEAHHVFPKSRLKAQFKYGAWRAQSGAFKREQLWRPIGRHGIRSVLEVETLSLDDILADPRNLMVLCSEGHHERVTNHRIYTDIPDSVWAFCADYGLTAQLESDLRKAA